MSALDTLSPASRQQTAPPAPRGGIARHPVRTELLRGSGMWAGAALAASVIIAVVAGRYALYDTWTAAQAALREVGLILGGPLALAAGSWQGARERRRETGELLLSTARSPLRRALVAAAPAALWPALGQLAATAVCLGMLLPYPAYGHPVWHLVVVDAVALAALGVLGFAAGRALPWRFAPPLIGVAGYLLIGVAAYAHDGTTWLSPGYSAWGRLGDSPVWWAGVLSMVWTTGLAGAALLAGHARRRTLAVLPLLAAVAAGSVLYSTGDGLRRSDRAAAARVCDQGTPTICVRAVHGSALPAVRAVVDRIDARLEGVPGAPVRYREGGSSERAPAGEVRFELYGGVFRGRLGDEEMLYRDFVYAVTLPRCEEAHGGDFAAEHAAQEWLLLRAPLSPADPARNRLATTAAERLRALAPADRRAWLGRYLAGVQACDRSGVPAP